MDNRLFEKFQPNVKRGVVKACEVCQKPFNFIGMEYEHQCKRCLRAICKECGKNKRQIYKVGMSKSPHRTCTICVKQSDYLRQYISTNNLKFGSDCPISRKWLSKLPQTQIDDQQQQKSVNNVKNKFSYEFFKELWDAYNYSFRQFVGLLTFERNQKQIFEYVNSVYQQLLLSGFDEKLEHIMFIIVFLLCFCSTKSAFQLITHLITLRQNVTDSKQLLQVYLKGLRVDDSNIKKLNDYINLNLKKYLTCFSVNMVSVECSIYVITKLIERSKIQQMFIFLSILLQDNSAKLEKYKSLKKQCQFEIVKGCKIDKYLQKYRQISSIKTAQYVKPLNKKQDNLKMSSHESRYSPIQSPPFSSKTKSIHESSRQFNQSESEVSQRKTQKNMTSSKKQLNAKNIVEESEFYHKGMDDCFQCQKNLKKIEDLKGVLKMKEKQIQNLTFKLSFKRKQSQDDYKRTRLTTEYMYKQNQELSKMERQLLEKSQQSQNFLQQLAQSKRENGLLKVKIEELQRINKILRNNVNSPHGKVSVVPEAVENQQDKIFQSLKKTLDNKNKQLQEVIKKNKLLNYQLEQMQKQYAIQKTDPSTGSRDDLLKKIEELSKQVNQQQSEKIKIAEELFYAKQEIKSNSSGKGQSISEQNQKNAKTKQCTIF